MRPLLSHSRTLVKIRAHYARNSEETRHHPPKPAIDNFLALAYWKKLTVRPVAVHLKQTHIYERKNVGKIDESITKGKK